jgi:hypothetical protein
MSILLELLCRSNRNDAYHKLASFYHDYWTTDENIKRLISTPISTCSLCSLFDRNAIAVLGIYYDSLPFLSVTMLDAAVVTIMSLLREDQLSIEDETFKNLVETVNPDVIRNHFFINSCNLREKSVQDWDVTKILKAIMLHMKTDTICLRQYANLTKFLKNECQGSCNSFLNHSQLEVIEKQHKETAPKFFVSEKCKTTKVWSGENDNTAKRLDISCQIIANR